MGIEDQREAWRKAHPEYLLPDGTVDIDKLCVRGDDTVLRVPQPSIITVGLPQDEAQALQDLADSQGITLVVALRRAIATEAYIRGEIVKGSKVLLLTADGEVREVLYR